MLKDSRIPTPCLDYHRLAALIEAVDAHRKSPRHQRGEAIQAQTSLKKYRRRLLEHRQARIDDDMKRHHTTLALLENGRSNALEVFLAILDDRQSQRLADLRGGEAYSRGLVHHLPHVLDQTLDG